MRIAIPCEAPGGLGAVVSPHFGHCDAFTVVDVQDEQVGEVRVLANSAHERGGCMGPVMLLKDAGVHVLVSGGMGRRPLQGFHEVGIEVWFSEHLASVAEVVELAVRGRARVFGLDEVCGGGHDAGRCR